MATLSDAQLEDIFSHFDSEICRKEFPGCTIWTGILDFEDEECGEEIDVPARNEAEARERVLQMAAKFYIAELTVVRSIQPLGSMPGTVVMYR